jgi:hypothetical protein
LDEGKTYYAILELEDNVGNKATAAGAFKFDTGCEITAVDISIPEACDFDELEFCNYDSNGNPIFILDPGWAMDEDCYTNCVD